MEASFRVGLLTPLSRVLKKVSRALRQTLALSLLGHMRDESQHLMKMVALRHLKMELDMMVRLLRWPQASPKSFQLVTMIRLGKLTLLQMH